MVDVHSPDQRSFNMSRIKGKNTKPEMIVRQWLWRNGLRYRLHRNDLPGKPDIVFTGRKKVIFVNGCFWHQHPGCKRATIPETRKEFWEMLIRLKEKGITILVSTPYMDEANLCDRVALIQNGDIMSIDTPGKIIGDFGRKLWAIKSNNIYQLINDLKRLDFIDTVFPFGEFLHVTSNAENLNITELKSILNEKNHRGIKIQQIEANIEDCFMQLMNS